MDADIASHPKSVSEKLNEIRQIVHEKAPDAYEKISYQMPTLFYYHSLVHFAAFPIILGFIPEAAVLNFQEQLSSYHFSRGSIRFILDKPLPKAIIAEIVRFRVNEENRQNHK
ncbi:MAG: iron chaperone [Bacilli bacterium]